MWTRARPLLRWSTLLATVLLAGCAPAYHSYSGCYVDCQYCPPPPLPYTHYGECVCHSLPAEPYLYPEVAALEQGEAVETPQLIELDDSESNPADLSATSAIFHFSLESHASGAHDSRQKRMDSLWTT